MLTLEKILKQSAVLFIVLALIPIAASGQARSSSARFSSPLLDDVVRMTRSGMSEGAIVSYVKARRARLESVLTAEDLIGLRRAGVGETVIQYLASIPSEVGRQEATYDSGEARAYPVDVYGDGPYVGPYWYGYPWWGWGPGFSGSVFIAGRPFLRHRFFFRRPFLHRPFFRGHLFGHRFAHRPFFRGRFR